MEHICYICGREAKFQFKNKKWYCASNVSQCPTIKEKYRIKTLNRWKEVSEGGLRRLKDLTKEKTLIIDNGLCSYGCGKPWKFKTNNGKFCCEESYNKCPAIRNNNSKVRKEQCKNGITLCNFIHGNLAGHPVWNKGKTKQTDTRIAKYAETIKLKAKESKFTRVYKKHTKESKEKLSIARSKNISNAGSGGFRDIKWYKTLNVNRDEITVRGTWELYVAEYLTRNNIVWTRKILKYTLGENVKRYTPDFYVPSIDKYIEVKGYFSGTDKIKMKLSIEQNNVQIILVDNVWLNKLKKDEIKLFDIPNYKS